MRKLLNYIWLLSAAITVMSCSKHEISSGDGGKIAFYIKTQQAVTASSRSLIEDTDDLLKRGLPLYVTEEFGSVFSDTEVAYTDNGVWRSDKEWEADKEYTFYAYIASSLMTATDTQGGITVSKNGKVVYIQQPKQYSSDTSVWADYLMSYRVGANGSAKGLVRLDMERVTACVELYVAKSDNISRVQITSISFNNVKTYASFNLANHAVPGEQEGPDGMKNVWAVEPYENSVTIYERRGNIELKNYTGDRFNSDFLQMKFLVVPQSLIDGPTVTINYQVNENDIWSDYSSTFILSDYSIKSWERGHKIRYFIGIDTSIGMEGVVEPWKSVDYIETTLLPND